MQDIHPLNIPSYVLKMLPSYLSILYRLIFQSWCPTVLHFLQPFDYRIILPQKRALRTVVSLQFFQIVRTAGPYRRNPSYDWNPFITIKIAYQYIKNGNNTSISISQFKKAHHFHKSAKQNEYLFNCAQSTYADFYIKIIYI